MTIAEAFLQGILQGLTEFLPVSSSGHLSLFQYFTGNSGESAFLFTILLHMGTLIAVCVVFHSTIWELIREVFSLLADLFTGRFRANRMPAARRMLIMLFVSLLPLFLMVFLKDRVSRFSTDNDITVEGFCFLVTGILLLSASPRGRGRKTAANMSAKDAVAIGAAQVIATMPGISRSGSTICTGLLLGLERSYAVSYSFILGIPAVLGAIVLELGSAAEESATLPPFIIVVGMLTSIIAGILSIKLVQWVVKGNKLKYFGYYALALGILVIIAGTIDTFSGHMIQNYIASL